MVDYTDEQKSYVYLVDMISESDKMRLAFLPAINNETGASELLLGALIMDGDDPPFKPLAVALPTKDNDDEIWKKYTLDEDCIDFSDMFDCGCENCQGACGIEDPEDFVVLPVQEIEKPTKSPLTRRFYAAIMLLLGRD